MNITGVYAIICTENGKVYVGSAAHSFKRRWKQHRANLRGNGHENRYLQAAWNKYGEKSFEFIILEECTPDECVNREQFWIDQKHASLRKFGYNISPTAGSALGVKRDTEALRAASEIRKLSITSSLASGRIGFLSIIETIKSRRGFAVLARCDCGNEIRIPLRKLEGRRSCGCGLGSQNHSGTNQKQRMERRCKWAGKSYSMPAEFNAWKSIISRCTNPKHPQYQRYGGRGIEVCPEWMNSFEDFLRDMGARPNPKMVFTRINKNKGYLSNNCKWAMRRKTVPPTHFFSFMKDD